VLLFLSVLGYVNVAMLNNPRLLRVMSEDRLLPAQLARADPRTGALAPALVTFCALCLGALFYAQTFDQILNYTMFLDSIGMATSAAALFVLRRRRVAPEGVAEADLFQVRPYPLIPLLFIGAYLFIGASIALADPGAALRGLAIFAAFLLVYALLLRPRR
jgi:APA family basic amino acid/polyamine antiporter